MALASRQ
jgi:hypothetical protein